MDKLREQFQKECENREAGQLSLPRILGVASPVQKVTRHVRRTEVPIQRKIQTTLNFVLPPHDKLTSRTSTPRRGGRNASGDRIKYNMWSPPAQRCAGVRFNIDGQARTYLREEQKPNDQVSAIPPAATRLMSVPVPNKSQPCHR